MLPLLALAGVKMFTDAQKEKRDKELAAATQRLSPWTHMQAQPVAYADPAGTAMQTYGSAVAMDQNEGNQMQQQKLIDAQTNYFKNMSKYNPYGQPGQQ